MKENFKENLKRKLNDIIDVEVNGEVPVPRDYALEEYAKSIIRFFESKNKQL